MNRLERIEKAAEEVLAGRKWMYDMETEKKNVTLPEALTILEKALKPETDWSKVKMGDVLNHSSGSSGKYINSYNDTEMNILATDKYGDEFLTSWSKSNCAVVKKTGYTDLIKNDWPEDGKKPEWMHDDDRIIPNKHPDDSIQKSITSRAKYMRWGHKRDWFSVIKP